jgi:hypothetical protein
MNEINWKEKLTSRKFWVAIAQFVSMLIIAFKGSQETATQVTAIIMAGAAVVAYIIGEGLRDAAQAKNTTYVSGYTAFEPPEENSEEKAAEEN